MTQHFLVAIPVFNEARYINSVLDEVEEFASNILVIDDGSTDGTAAILRRRAGISVITHPENRGYGQSIACAFGYAQRHMYSWLVTMDCDEQHESSYIPRFMAAAREDRSDIISGTRYPNGFARGPGAPPDRRRINERLTRMLNTELGLRITDAFCGFKAYRAAALQHIRITVPGYAMPMQFWVQAANAGLRITELPVPLIYNDLNRHFGGLLDDPQIRLNHYLHVYRAERAAYHRPVCRQTTPAACR